MEMDHRKARAFLYELCTQTGGDCDVQVSMYDIGTAVGLEKDDVELISQSLYIQDLRK